MGLVNLLIGTAVGAGIVACVWELAGLIGGLAMHRRETNGSSSQAR